MGNDAKATNTVNTANCGYTVLPTMLSLEEILRDAVRRQATYQVQFADYDVNTWTAPSQLTQNRMEKLLDDGSIRKVRLELEFEHCAQHGNSINNHTPEKRV